MPEKGGISPVWVSRSNPVVQRGFKLLTLAFFSGILIVCLIDGVNYGNVRRDFLVQKVRPIHQNPAQNHSDSSPAIELNLTHHENLIQIHQNSRETHENLAVNSTEKQLSSSNFTPPMPENLTHDERNPINPVIPKTLDWISTELESNYSSNLLSDWLAPGGEPCKESKTVDIRFIGFDFNDQIELSTGDIHEFAFQALDDSGIRRCLGGDYFETDLSGDSWKSRPPVKDLGNGTYKFSVQIHPDFAGNYGLTIILLFRHYEGLKFSPQRFAFDRTLRIIPIKFRKSGRLPEIKQCRSSDLTRNVWSGRWTRHAKNDSCPISNDGRYRCQQPDFPCPNQWCGGSLGLLESNGWVYSTHCSFKIFSGENAWNCLNNRWIFWWGDSNHCDTVRNILKFVLDVQDIPAVPRRFDMNITNRKDPNQSVRITSIFNGHPNDTGNYQGLNSLSDGPYRELLKGYFSGEVVPDTIIMNSGLHDGVFWRNIRQFVRGADYAAAFWAEVLEGVRRRGLVPPKIIYRTTVATGGYARSLAFNPQKMEAFNGVVLDKLRSYGAVKMVIDDFDMTYPWHYDNRCNDGVHYGRAPLKMKWRDGGIGHQYFVDLMLCHVLFNALCAR